MAVAHTQTVVNDTIYFVDNTIEVGQIIDSSGQFITIKPLNKKMASISFDKTSILSTSNPDYSEEYFTVYKQKLFEKYTIESNLKVQKKIVDPKVKAAKILTFTGLATGLISGFILYGISSNENFGITNDATVITAGVFITAGVVVNIGISAWINGAIKSKQNSRQTTYFELSTKGLGVQATLHF